MSTQEYTIIIVAAMVFFKDIAAWLINKLSNTKDNEKDRQEEINKRFEELLRGLERMIGKLETQITVQTEICKLRHEDKESGG